MKAKLRTLFPFATALVVGALAVYAVAAMCRDVPEAPDYRVWPGDWINRNIVALDERPYDVVIIGNSSAAQLEGLVSENSENHPLLSYSKILAYGMTTGAEWYFTFRNLILPARYRPRLVAVLYFEGTLWVERGSPKAHPLSLELQRRSRGRAPRWGVLPSSLSARRLIPPRTVEKWVRARCYEACRWCAADANTVILSTIWKARPLVDSIRNPLPGQAAGGSPDGGSAEAEALFREQLEHSYIPDMVELSLSSGVPILFVRLKTRCDFPDEKCPPGEKAYYDGLNRVLGAYLAERGTPYSDLSAEPRIQVSDMADKGHLKHERMEVLADLLDELFRARLDSPAR